MNARYDLAVVGSGIVGLGAAYAAARRGLRVVVVDRSAAPHGASVRNFGHLCIGAQSGPAREYADLSRELWLRLAADAGFWLRTSGTLVAARADDEMAVLSAAADTGGIELLTAEELADAAPVDPAVVTGGARIAPDLQTDPRTAVGAIARHLETLGVEFRMRTAVTGVGGGLVSTSRGEIAADTVVVAVNHDLDHLLPGLAEEAGVIRCGLDMVRAQVALRRPLDAPLLTGWSLARYGRFAALPETAVLRDRLHAERADLAAMDLNQMYTQLPDGSLILGDSHRKGIDAPPFQPEAAMDAFLDEAATLFGTPRPRVIERWLGVYATAPNDFLVREIEPGVLVLAATTGIGMTTGLGLAEASLRPLLGTAITGTPLAGAAGSGTAELSFEGAS